MKNRLEVARTLLKDDGVIFISIDNSPSEKNGEKESPELGYLMVLMDEIFGRKNYISTLIWKKKGNPSNTETSIGTITESVLMYAKKFSEIDINLQEYKRVYSFMENDGTPYNLEFPVKTNEGDYERKTMMYGIETKEGVFFPPNGKRWTIGEDKAINIVKQGKYIIEEGKFKIKKYPSDYTKGDKKLYNNLLLEQGSLKSAKNELKLLGFNREEFDTPKPEALIQRIIELATNENDIVLDFHLGSGTTAVVAHKMGRQYIGIEQMDYIESIAVERLKKLSKASRAVFPKLLTGRVEALSFILNSKNTTKVL